MNKLILTIFCVSITTNTSANLFSTPSVKGHSISENAQNTLTFLTKDMKKLIDLLEDVEDELKEKDDGTNFKLIEYIEQAKNILTTKIPTVDKLPTVLKKLQKDLNKLEESQNKLQTNLQAMQNPQMQGSGVFGGLVNSTSGLLNSIPFFGSLISGVLNKATKSNPKQDAQKAQAELEQVSQIVNSTIKKLQITINKLTTDINELNKIFGLIYANSFNETPDLQALLHKTIITFNGGNQFQTESLGTRNLYTDLNDLEQMLRVVFNNIQNKNEQILNLQMQSQQTLMMMQYRQPMVPMQSFSTMQTMGGFGTFMQPFSNMFSQAQAIPGQFMQPLQSSFGNIFGGMQSTSTQIAKPITNQLMQPLQATFGQFTAPIKTLTSIPQQLANSTSSITGNFNKPFTSTFSNLTSNFKV